MDLSIHLHIVDLVNGQHLLLEQDWSNLGQDSQQTLGDDWQSRVESLCIIQSAWDSPSWLTLIKERPSLISSGSTTTECLLKIIPQSLSLSNAPVYKHRQSKSQSPPQAFLEKHASRILRNHGKGLHRLPQGLEGMVRIVRSTERNKWNVSFERPGTPVKPKYSVLASNYSSMPYSVPNSLRSRLSKSVLLAGSEKHPCLGRFPRTA